MIYSFQKENLETNENMLESQFVLIWLFERQKKTTTARGQFCFVEIWRLFLKSREFAAFDDNEHDADE